jgi:cell division protein FtsL
MQRIESLTHAYSQAPWRKQMQYLVPLLLILVFAALVAVLYLRVNAQASTVGSKIQEMQTDILRLERENAGLQSYLGELLSADKMLPRALQLGFQPVQMDQAIYIVVPGYMERQPVVMAPTNQRQVTRASVRPAEYTEPLFTWLGRHITKVLFPALENR